MHYKLNNQLYWFDTEAEAAEYQPEAILITDEEALVIQAENEAKAKAEYEASLTYKDKRAQAYPPLQDLADGIVKQHSDDPIIKAEGDAQIAEYAAKCLAIKASIPKETA